MRCPWFLGKRRLCVGWTEFRRLLHGQGWVVKPDDGGDIRKRYWLLERARGVDAPVRQGSRDSGDRAISVSHYSVGCGGRSGFESSLGWQGVRGFFWRWRHGGRPLP